MRKYLLAASVFAILLFNISFLAAQLILLFATPDGSSSMQFLGRATNEGIVQFCINTPPNITIPCNTTLSQNVTFACNLTLSDDDGHNVTVTQQIVSGSEVFNVTPNGTIVVRPTNEDVGNHSVLFIADDGLACSNSLSNATFNFSVLNVNDPPYLVQNIPDQTVNANTTLTFFLTDYFADPDGDPLNFSVSTATGITVQVLSGGEVRITGASCDAEDSVIFTATDPYDASADSNLVEIQMSCPQSGGGGGEGQGGGGGGGGGASACTPAWECQEWFACLPSGIQWRRCYDKNGCEVERYLQRQCEYGGQRPVCLENWLCEEWQACFPNGTQYRSCEDLASCGTTLALPPLEQGCVYIPACNDGLQNGDETGVDCGGSCVACALLERPGVITGGGIAMWVLLLILLAILLVSGVLRYYHSEIARLFATIGFLLRHRAYKDILLDAAQRKALFERIRAFEERAPDEEIYDGLAMLVRGYYVEALGIPLESLPEEVAARCRQLKLRPETTALLTGLFAKLAILEQEELEYDRYFVMATLEELRTLVCLTSDFTQEEIVRVIEEVAVTDKMSFYDEIFARTINLLRAVQFNQLEIARREYSAILRVYDPLSQQDQDQVYPELQWLFEATKFQSEITGARVVEKVPVAAE